MKPFAIVLTAGLIFTSCALRYDYHVTGKIVDANNKAIENVKLSYQFFPVEDFQYWLDNSTDTVLFTNTNGNFTIESSISIMHANYDSIRILIQKEDFEDRILVSSQHEWKRKHGIKYMELKYHFGMIELESGFLQFD